MPKIIFINADGSHLDCEIIHGTITIGRASTNDVFLDDSSVSKFHATVEHHNHVTLIHDQDSTNGITVNGVSTVSAELHEGDRVKVGDISGVFYESSEDDRPLGAEPSLYSTMAGIPVSMAQMDEDNDEVHHAKASSSPHPLQKKKGAMEVTARSPNLSSVAKPDKKTGVVPKIGTTPQVPARRPLVVPPYTGPSVVVQQKSDAPGGLFYLALIFLILLAFGGGLYLRHQRETNGGNFFKDAIEAKTGGKVGLDSLNK